MRRFQIHTVESAPEPSKPILANSEKALGFASSLLGIMAESPALVQGFSQLSQLLSQSSLQPLEREVILMTIGRENGCGYCMAFHTLLCGKLKVPDDIVKALRTGSPLTDPRLETLAEFTRTVVREKGHINDELWARFVSHGFTRTQAFDILVAVGMQAMSNYANHMGTAVLEPALREFAWSRDT